MFARAHKKFQRGQHSEIYLLTLKEQGKTKMGLPLDMVSKHAFWYLYLPDYVFHREISQKNPTKSFYNTEEEGYSRGA